MRYRETTLPMVKPWTLHQINMVMKLNADGYSYSIIAEVLHETGIRKDVSRCSVAGVVSRSRKRKGGT